MILSKQEKNHIQEDINILENEKKRITQSGASLRLKIETIEACLTDFSKIPKPLTRTISFIRKNKKELNVANKDYYENIESPIKLIREKIENLRNMINNKPFKMVEPDAVGMEKEFFYDRKIILC